MRNEKFKIKKEKDLEIENVVGVWVVFIYLTF